MVHLLFGCMALFILSSLGACSWKMPNTDGARAIVDQQDSVTKVDLVTSIAPDLIFNDKQLQAFCGSPELADQAAMYCLNVALYHYHGLNNLVLQTDIRNRVQGELRNASDLRCADFEQNLNNLASLSNLTGGVISTLLGGVGAIVTNASAARAFSGSAGIVSGSRAEFNADLFYKSAAPILVKAIEKNRGDARNNMDKYLAEALDKYSLEAAIGDALRYNNSCSLVVALGELDKDVTLAGEETGVTKALEIYDQVNQKVNGAAPAAKTPLPARP